MSRCFVCTVVDSIAKESFATRERFLKDFSLGWKAFAARYAEAVRKEKVHGRK